MDFDSREEYAAHFYQDCCRAIHVLGPEWVEDLMVDALKAPKPPVLTTCDRCKTRRTIRPAGAEDVALCHICADTEQDVKTLDA